MYNKNYPWTNNMYASFQQLVKNYLDKTINVIDNFLYFSWKLCQNFSIMIY